MYNVDVMPTSRKRPPIGTSAEAWFEEEEARAPGFIAAIDAEAGKHILGQRLRELREAAGLSQADLARKIGTKQPGIARVESGEAQQTLEMIYKIASAVGMTVEVVFRPRNPGRARKPRRTHA